MIHSRIGSRRTKKIYVGSVAIGGDAPVVVQSMTNTDTRDFDATVSQIRRLEARGCEVVRVAVPDMDAASTLERIKKAISIPLIADIHFDYRLALAALRAGVDGLRLNPGNIGGREKIRRVVKEALDRRVPIRVGVNSGSLEKDILARYGRPSPEALVESALRNVRILEDEGFNLIKISIKSSSVMDTIRAYMLLSEKVDYPLHLGVTEAGTLVQGAVKSAVGLGVLLYHGIGDTIRVSITGPPEEEMPIAYGILRSLGLRERGVEVISCPTCGRTEIDVLTLACEIEKRTATIKKPLKVAVMGCVVNGPGEAREADVGIAGGRGKGIIFKKGRVVKKIAEAELLYALLREIEELTGEPLCRT
ncbi:flavodoxin-dependent (E)-4-hydroxy-3-methylbut-2-enyl-diphosphate synthase [Thermodesulforhabdus norvegica]|uniref:4-hydroxy-3-methylbut-2-en-1-yl diphosphate synthase (flavodoxin) n=1 Tax=Thermodesulforhabdus norvegica TaxID=39841 RepID=A0A1I4TEY4_9BACT|nr:flavodoxin-dependent (E)-4-hydroxy-3-methylbut-2-enyl-diphosphate synthase [Thermodesulforhabdus norvegica]SFM75262.1 4-hydroxy-3-methylbut-2-en-1-yl diphosphate synthase [Thermodesulforhabdus norvegica]